MTDNKLTDNEIKQALECCSGNFACDKCSMNFKATLNPNETCGHDLMKLALDLINRLEYELEIWKRAALSENKTSYAAVKYELMRYRSLTDYIMRLKEKIDELKTEGNAT